jgi:WD40-like Beta Propeller Repeat
MNAHDTETRLRDALGAAARTVPDNASGPGLERPGSHAARRWPVITLAAAVAIALAVVVPYALLRPGPTNPSAHPSTRTKTTAPPYFAGIARDGVARVYDSATGKPRAEIPVEAGLAVRSVAAAADRRTFYFGATDAACGGRILRVVLEPDGTVASVTDVPKSAFPGQSITVLAVSPDGRRLAVSSFPARGSGGVCLLTTLRAPLVVLDVTTGDRQTWASSQPGVPRELSWAPDNRTLAFAWVEASKPEQLRVLDTSAPGRDLAASRQVYRSPGGNLSRTTITADGRWAQVVLGGKGAPETSLLRIALASGEVEVLDDRLREKGITFVEADTSREHLLAWGQRKAGRYQDGRVDWFGGTHRMMDAAW